MFTVFLGVSLLGGELARRAATGVVLALAGTGVVIAARHDLASLDGGSTLGVFRVP